MKLKVLIIAVVLAVIYLFTGILYAANGDLIVTGNVGIGTTTPNAKLQISGGHASIDANKFITVNPAETFIYDTKAMSHYGLGWFTDSAGGSPTAWLSGYGGMKFFTAGQRRFAINESGKVGISTLAAATANHLCYDTTSITGMNTFALCSSLRELKKDIAPLALKPDVLMQLNPVSFTDKASGEHHFGFIAEDVNAVNSTLSSYYKGKLNGVDYDSITSLLVKTVQEQQGEIGLLKLELCRKDKAYSWCGTLDAK